MRFNQSLLPSIWLKGFNIILKLEFASSCKWPKGLLQDLGKEEIDAAVDVWQHFRRGTMINMHELVWIVVVTLFFQSAMLLKLY